MSNLHDQYTIAHGTLSSWLRIDLTNWNNKLEYPDAFACIAIIFTLPIVLLSGRYFHPRGQVWHRIH